MGEGRTLEQLIGRRNVVEYPISGGPGLAQPGAQPLGSETGAPPDTRFRTVQVIPSNAANANDGPTRIVEADRASRDVTLTAPNVGFTVWIGGSGVSPGNGLALVPGQPYDLIIRGNQDVYAVTDAPVYVPLQVQVAPLLIGDRERRLG